MVKALCRQDRRFFVPVGIRLRFEFIAPTARREGSLRLWLIGQKEFGHIVEHNLNISDWISCQRGRLDIALLIVMMMRICLNTRKLLLIVPAQ